jgi:hypothetical protein
MESRVLSRQVDVSGRTYAENAESSISLMTSCWSNLSAESFIWRGNNIGLGFK